MPVWLLKIKQISTWTFQVSAISIFLVIISLASRYYRIPQCSLLPSSLLLSRLLPPSPYSLLPVLSLSRFQGTFNLWPRSGIKLFSSPPCKTYSIMQTSLEKPFVDIYQLQKHLVTPTPPYSSHLVWWVGWEWPPQAHRFASLVSSWWDFWRELGGMALL